MDGSHEYAELAPQLGLPAPEEVADYLTVSGLRLEALRPPPEVRDPLDPHLSLIPLSPKAGQRIEQIRISRLPE